MIYRHGDILIQPYESKEELKSLGEFKSYILAEGETTGHKHLLVSEKLMEVFQKENGEIVFKLNSPAKISHEEHNEIIIQPGIYEVGNEREFNYFENATQRVVD